MNIGESLVVFSTSNHILQNTTTFTDSELIAPMIAGETYALEIHKWVNAPNVGTPPGYKWRLNPDAGLAISGDVNYKGTTALNSNSVSATTGTGANTFINDNVCQFIQGVITASGTSGNVTLQFAQNTSNTAQTTLQAHSSLKLTRIA